MAAQPPDRFAWESNYLSKYLIRSQEGILAVTGDDPNTIFTVQDTNQSGRVNIMLSETELYLEGVPATKEGKPTIQITATASEANNDPDNAKCTLFKVISVGDKLRFIHVYSQLYLIPDTVDGVSGNVLCAVNKGTDTAGKDLFTAVAPK